MDGVCLEKEKLRKVLLKQRREAGRDAALDARIACALAGSEIWQAAHSVFLYLPLGWEIDTRALIGQAFAQGKRVAVPVSGPDGRMEAVQITAETPLRPGRFGILEPGRTGEILLPQDASLIVVPALAYDRRGIRIGRGGGYYDRWLACTPGISIGLCYTQYLFACLPCQAHDRRVDAICTQEGILWTES